MSEGTVELVALQDLQGHLSYVVFDVNHETMVENGHGG